MNLRKTIRAPKPFQGEVVDEVYLRHTPPSTSSTRELAYRGGIVDFNPNLPLAAFPTRDFKNPRPQVGSRPKHNKTPRPAVPQGKPPTRGTGPNSADERSFARPQQAVAADEREFRSFSADIEEIGAEIVGNHPDTSNNPGNPIWEQNMRRMKVLGERSMGDEIMAEMETSDEEKPAKCPKWEEISLGLRLRMIHAAAGNSSKVERPYQALRLTIRQREVMTAALRDFQNVEAAEDEDIAKHQVMVHEALTARGFLRVPSKAFREALCVYLYQDIERNDTFTDPTEMSKARAYMRHHGLDPDWLEASETESMDSDTIDEMCPNAVTKREMVKSTAEALNASMQSSEDQTGETRLVIKQPPKDQSEQTVSSKSLIIQPCKVAKDPPQDPQPQVTDHTPETTQASLNPTLRLAEASQTMAKPIVQPQEKKKRAYSTRKKPAAKGTVKVRKIRTPQIRANEKDAASQSLNSGPASNSEV
ncbi:MAG: hypothetical protein Q9214_004036 [Letrouitia sp. 1 TL-2023]